MAKCFKSKVINVAKKEVGYEEKKSNAFLNFKHKNVGSNNYTKYGKWIGANGDYWCASFLSWIFYKAYGEAKGKELLCGYYSPACDVIRSNFVRKNQFKTSSPAKGDVIFFKGTRHAGANHIGIVTRVENQTVYTIEGNANGTDTDNGGEVIAKSYHISNPRILGYGRPKYDKPAKAHTKLRCKLYKKPNTVSGSYFSVTVGKVVTILQDTGKGWSHVQIDGQKGYIKNSCIDSSKPLSKYPKSKVITTNAPVRKKNSKASKKIATAHKGDVVKIVSKGKYWDNVKYKGKDGFIARKRLM